MKTFYLTTPIYYPNARPHVGSAYTTIVCDVLARYKRMCGYEVAFLTGTDEHGEKIERAAAAAGQTPSQFVAEKRKLFIQLWEELGIPVSVYPEGKPDSLRFIYTTHPDHTRSVRRMLIRAKENGHITKRQYAGRYCVSDERYISDGAEPANCDICGRPAELISEENYFFKLSEFREKLLNLYSERPGFVQPDYRMNEVKRFVEGDLRDISVSRKRIKWGIPFPLDEERDDPEQVVYVWYDALTSYMTGIGYAQGENGNAEFQKYWRNRPGESELVHMIGKDILRFHAVYWPAFIMAAYPGQAEMLPTTVFAHGWIYYEQDKMSKSKGNVVYPEPIVEALDSFGAPGNDALRYYLLREAPFGQDTSFSYEGLIQRYNSDLANDLGNLANRTITMLNRYFQGVVPAWIDVGVNSRDEELRVTFFGQQAPDFLKKELDLPSSPDHAEIAAKLGLPPAVASNYAGVVRATHEAFDRHDFSNALANIWYGVYKVNSYLVIDKPWSLESSNPRLAMVLYRATDLLATVAVLIYPVLPESAERLWKQLGCESYLGKIRNQRLTDLKWGRLNTGTRVTEPAIIFPRLDKAAARAKLEEFAEIDRERGRSAVGALHEAPLQTNPQTPRQTPVQLNLAEPGGEPDKSKEAFLPVQTENKPEASPKPAPEAKAPSSQAPTPSPQPLVPGPQSPAPSPQPPAPSLISINDFAKVEMRVGEVKAAEHVPGASKLLKLMVDIGTEVRQVVAGLAEYYRPEDLVGMKVVVVTNLQPRKLRGVESNGMIVAASVGDHGRPVLVTFKEDVENGARLK
jgi:methionyl-tRNA synthetase